MEGPAPTDILLAARRLEAALAGPWPLATEALEALRSELLSLTTASLRPLAERADGPMVAVLAGSTGVGKSTLLNGLAGRRITDASVLRPTTTRPVGWCHPTHAAAFAAREFGGVEPEVAVDERSELEGLIVVDAPDFDSAAAGHRAMADALLAAADIVVFVSTPARFGDRASWDRVIRGLGRDVPMLHVLNRTDGAGVGAVRSTAPVRARAKGLYLEADEFIPVAEQALDPATLGPPHDAVRHILSLLVEISLDDADLARAQALEGARRAVTTRAGELVGILSDAAPRVDAALDAVEAVVRRAVDPALPEEAVARFRAPSIVHRLRRGSASVPESLVAVVEARLRVEVAAAAAAMRTGWLSHLPSLPSGLPDEDAVVRSAWASWLHETAGDLGSATGQGWRDAVLGARGVLATPYRDAARRSMPDLDAVRDAIRLLGDME